MKLSLTFLALAHAVATVQAGLDTDWNITFSKVDQSGSVYTFTYDSIDTARTLDNMKSSVMNYDCDETSTFASNVHGNPFDVGVDYVVDAMDMTLADGTAQVIVSMDMEKAVAEGSGSLWTAGDNGGGTLKYCVRSGLFAGDNEVNYLENLVTVTIRMEGGFSVSDISVDEKAKVEDTKNQRYGVTANLCSSGDGTDGAFLQGSLICVEVNPDDDSSDVEVTEIKEFGWWSGDEENRGNEFDTEGDENYTEQVALPLAGDGLTSYAGYGSNTFSTILYAQFYESGIPVEGAGSATLAFKARRLGASGSEMNRRVLQGIDAEQKFDIVADIVKSDDSPTALQTAGGATASFVVTIVGLVVGAVLLA